MFQKFISKHNAPISSTPFVATKTPAAAAPTLAVPDLSRSTIQINATTTAVTAHSGLCHVVRIDETNPTNHQALSVAEGQWYRTQPDRVAFPYNALDGFPFYSALPSTDLKNRVLVNTDNYDEIFQSMQLAHWNMQTKFNINVYRHTPTTRDSIMTS